MSQVSRSIGASVVAIVALTALPAQTRAQAEQAPLPTVPVQVVVTLDCHAGA